MQMPLAEPAEQVLLERAEHRPQAAVAVAVAEQQPQGLPVVLVHRGQQGQNTQLRRVGLRGLAVGAVVPVALRAGPVVTPLLVAVADCTVLAALGLVVR
jgi:hypothetical protein